MGLIYHITTRNQWKSAQRAGVYRADSLEKEGFIHLSTREQVLGTANLLFQGVHDLVLLEVGEDRLQAVLRYEPSGGADLFPHLYGPLNLDAVTRRIDFPTQPDGRFILPDTLVSI